MKYTFHENTDPKSFDSFVVESEYNNLFQCTPWADIKDNWHHRFTCVTDESGNIAATALCLIRPLALGTTLMYVPRGPIMDYENEELVRFTISSLKELAKRQRAITLRFDPAVLSRKYPYRDRNEEQPYSNQKVIDLLKDTGAVHSGFTTMISESTQPRYNAEMDVTPDYRDHLEHRTRKCINAAEHKGIEVYEGTQYIHEFAKAMHYTEVRKSIALRNEAYFQKMMDVYGDHAICMVAKLDIAKQLAKLETCIKENEEKLNGGALSKKEKAKISQMLQNDRNEYEKLKADSEREEGSEVITCGILAVYNEKLMELFYMGNNPDYLRMYSSYLLYAKCLDRCVDLGITHCSFGGIEGTLDDGLTLFKSNWIMNVEEYIGEFNIILNRPMYTLFEKVYPFLLNTAMKLKSRS